MIKVAYYVGMNDKNSLKQELDAISFTKVFDNVFKDYTLQKAQGRFTNKNGQVTLENTLIVITIIDSCEEKQLWKLIETNCNILKETLNQESILVEVAKPGVIFC